MKNDTINYKRKLITYSKVGYQVASMKNLRAKKGKPIMVSLLSWFFPLYSAYSLYFHILKQRKKIWNEIKNQINLILSWEIVYNYKTETDLKMSTRLKVFEQKETEKAIQFFHEGSKQYVWIPKSAILYKYRPPKNLRENDNHYEIEISDRLADQKGLL